MTKTKMTIDARLAKVEKALGLDAKQTTRALIIIDKSGSMGARAPETISGYNEYIGTLKDDDSDELFVTTVQFDDQYEVFEESTPISKVKKLDTETYQVRGMTALHDAIGKGVNTLRKEMQEGDRALVVIMTDGWENASTEYSQSDVNKLIAKCEDEGNYTFVYMGAGRDSWTGAESLGITREKAVFYAGSPQAQSAAFSSLAASTSGYRSSRSMKSENLGTVTSDVMASSGAEVETEGKQPTPLWTPGKEDDDAEE